MRFTVFWSRDAEDDLADLWLRSSDRAAITWAAREIDRSLATDPLHQGESRAGSLRVAFAGPLGVSFEVVEADRAVYVIAVWRTSRPRV